MAPRTIPIATLSDEGEVLAYARKCGSLSTALGLVASSAQLALELLEQGKPNAAKLELRMALAGAKSALDRIEQTGELQPVTTAWSA